MEFDDRLNESINVNVYSCKQYLNIPGGKYNVNNGKRKVKEEDEDVQKRTWKRFNLPIVVPTM